MVAGYLKTRQAAHDSSKALIAQRLMESRTSCALIVALMDEIPERSRLGGCGARAVGAAADGAVVANEVRAGGDLDHTAAALLGAAIAATLAWQVQSWRYTGQIATIQGSPTGGRQHTAARGARPGVRVFRSARCSSCRPNPRRGCAP